MKIILGSSSPRRKEILNYFSLPYQIENPNIDEEAIEFEGDVHHYVTKIASEKGEALIKKFPEHLVITADTTVYLEGKVFNKPIDEHEAFKMLQTLAGKRHQVYTGVCITSKTNQLFDAEKTDVFFKPLSNNEIKIYQQAVHSYDKAGGYAIQGAGSLIVDKIEGDYSNVLGLPINTLQRLLKLFNVDLWNYL